MFRSFLKTILLILARIAIKKHGIKFIVICGWHRTKLVREEIYHYLSEDYNVRRNIQDIWWDLSLPLDILGYKDKRYKTHQWFKIIFKTIVSLITSPRNPHKFVIDLNFSDSKTSKYWKRIIKPDVLLILNYKKTEKALFDELIKSTTEDGGEVFVADILGKRFPKFGKFGVERSTIATPKNKYKYNLKLPIVFVETYPAVLTVLEKYGWDENRILKTITTYNFTEELISKIKSNIIKDKFND